jgi:hypothetical protein
MWVDEVVLVMVLEVVLKVAEQGHCSKGGRKGKVDGYCWCECRWH